MRKTIGNVSIPRDEKWRVAVLHMTGGSCERDKVFADECWATCQKGGTYSTSASFTYSCNERPNHLYPIRTTWTLLPPFPFSWWPCHEYRSTARVIASSERCWRYWTPVLSRCLLLSRHHPSNKKNQAWKNNLTILKCHRTIYNKLAVILKKSTMAAWPERERETRHHPYWFPPCIYINDRANVIPCDRLAKQYDAKERDFDLSLSLRGFVLSFGLASVEKTWRDQRQRSRTLYAFAWQENFLFCFCQTVAFSSFGGRR